MRQDRERQPEKRHSMRRSGEADCRKVSGRSAVTGFASTELTTKRSPPTAKRRQADIAEVSLTRGQENAIRASFKAGITPSRIARQFGVSQSDVRKALATDPSK